MEEKRILVKLDNQGRLFVPSHVRKALGIKAGDMLVLDVKDKQIEISTVEYAIEKAKEVVKEYAKGRKLWKELIEERRKEAKNE
ncbi:hypothetical protein HRbin37_02120 [bacterium HR37]|jgi:AbrB family looped-hinge helix DNA binding protein|nr:hypothetical protein HRbin37_02120 [bacterium HR37]